MLESATPNEAYSIKAVCKATGLGRTFIFEAIRRGELSARKCGRRTLILRDDLQAWLKSLPTIPVEAQ